MTEKSWDNFMFIQTESTPNPSTLKFLPGRTVMETGVKDFPDAASAIESPLAERLFAVDGVQSVFFGTDFITVTKGATEWQHMKPAVLGAIMEHFTSGAPVLTAQSTSGEEAASDEFNYSEEDAEIVDQIKDLLETRVRPAVAQDGGDIAFHGFDKGTVFVHMRGACAGCPSSTATLKMGIENMLRHYIPEVTEVQAVNQY